MENDGYRMLGRPPVARMLGIHALLKEKKYPNCQKIADQFESSVRSAGRDIEFMRERLKLPIVWDAKRNGYYYSGPVEELPSLPVSEAEMFAMMLSQKALGQYYGSPFEKPLEAAFRRIMGHLDQGEMFSVEGADHVSFSGFAPDEVDWKEFEVVRECMKAGRSLKLLYRNRGTTEWVAREVHPYHVVCRDYRWYLYGYDVDKKGVRTFALTRMKELVMGRKRFSKPEGFSLEEYHKGSLGVFKGKAEYQVVLRFDAFGADDVRGRRWHRSQVIEELGGGEIRLEMKLDSLQEVERWVRGFGEHVTVEGPGELRRRMAEMGEADWRKYKG